MNDKKAVAPDSCFTIGCFRNRDNSSSEVPEKPMTSASDPVRNGNRQQRRGKPTRNAR